MIVVVDASLAISWTIASQGTLAADALLRTANVQFVSPFVFALEVRNALLKAERQKKCSPKVTDEAIDFIANQLVTLESPPDENLLAAIVELARSERLSFFDAAYLEAAARLPGTLATRDSAMLQAAARHNVLAYDAR